MSKETRKPGRRKSPGVLKTWPGATFTGYFLHKGFKDLTYRRLTARKENFGGVETTWMDPQGQVHLVSPLLGAGHSVSLQSAGLEIS